MVIAFAENLKTHAVNGALDITKGFAKGVGAIIALKIDGLGPRLDQLADCLGLKGTVALPTFKQKVVISGIHPGQILLKALENRFVYHENVGFAGFGFLDADELTGFQVLQILDGQAQNVHGAKAVVDAESEEQVVPGRIGKHFGYGLDVFNPSDRVHGNAVVFFGVVVGSHGASFVNECLVYVLKINKLNIQSQGKKIGPREFHQEALILKGLLKNQNMNVEFWLKVNIRKQRKFFGRETFFSRRPMVSAEKFVWRVPIRLFFTGSGKQSRAVQKWPDESGVIGRQIQLNQK